MWSATGRARPRIGRSDVWATLLARRDRVVDGIGGLTLLEGAGGVGKSTFLALIAEESPALGFRVAVAKASRSEDPPPFRMIGDALKSFAAGGKGAVPPVPEATASTPLAFQPAVERGRDRFSAVDPLSSMTDDVHSEVASDRLQFFSTLAEPFLTAAHQVPVLLFLDDIHWADDASRAFLRHFLPQITGLPMWILATCAPPRTGPRALPDPLEGLRPLEGSDRVTLRPLTRPELVEFVQWAVPRLRLGEAEMQRLYSNSGGVPARVVQLLSPSASSPPEDEGSAAGEEEPALEWLDPEASRLLNLTLVAGPEVDLREIAEAAGLTEERTVEILEQFVSLGLIHELEDGRFAFDREETRDSLYARIPPRRLRLYHQKFAEGLLRRGAAGIAQVYSLARHAYLGGMDREAVEYNRRAATYAAERFQPEVSLLYLRLALDALSRVSPPDLPGELKLRLEIAVQQGHLGEVEGAEASLDEIRSSGRLWSATSPVDRALFWVYRARVLADQGRWDEAERSLQEMPANLHGWEPGDLRRLAFRLRGEIQFFRGEYAGAVEAHEAALEIAAQEGDTREVAAEQIRRATALSMVPGRESEALDGLRAAIERLDELGDHAEAAFGALCLGAQLNALGRVDDARVALQMAIELSDAANDLRRSGWAHLNLADLEFGLHRTAEAMDEIRKARSGFERVDDALGVARVALTEGRLALARGDHAMAERKFESARAIFRGRHMTPDELEVDLRSAELDLAREDVPGARRRLARVVEEGLARLRPDLVGEGRRIGRQLGPPAIEIG